MIVLCRVLVWCAQCTVTARIIGKDDVREWDDEQELDAWWRYGRDDIEC